MLSDIVVSLTGSFGIVVAERRLPGMAMIEPNQVPAHMLSVAAV
jgi:hypothetical protein